MAMLAVENISSFAPSTAAINQVITMYVMIC
jgi:hypothetical protein